MGVTLLGRTVTAGTVNGDPIPEVPDLARMRRQRSARLRGVMAERGVDALLLLGTSAVQYATGVPVPIVDASRATLLRPVALVLAGDPEPHLFTQYREAAAERVAADHIHPPLWVELDCGVADIAAALGRLVPGDATLAADEMPYPLRRALGGRAVTEGAPIFGAARLVKTADELACLRAVQSMNEAAMRTVQDALQPGVRQSELTGILLREAFEQGAAGVGVDAIWQVMPERRSDGPWAFHGDVAYPTPSSDRILREGDVLWVDSGIIYEGYVSDFGRTWLVGADPNSRQREHFARWVAVMQAVLDEIRPGATGGDLCRAARKADPPSAAEGGKPWLEQFYLAHGLGVDSAEMPFFGTDLGEEFDDSFVLEPGVAFELEPVIWAEGTGGYRSEDLVVVTDDGWAPLSDYTYAPYEEHRRSETGR